MSHYKLEKIAWIFTRRALCHMRIHSDVTTFESVRVIVISWRNPTSTKWRRMHWPWYQDQQCIKMIRHTIFEGQFSIYLISSRVSVSWRNTFFLYPCSLLCLFMPAIGEIGFTQCMPFPPPVMKLIGLHSHYFPSNCTTMHTFTEFSPAMKLAACTRVWAILLILLFPKHPQDVVNNPQTASVLQRSRDFIEGIQAGAWWKIPLLVNRETSTGQT